MESVWKKLGTEDTSGAAASTRASERCAYVSPLSHTAGCTTIHQQQQRSGVQPFHFNTGFNQISIGTFQS
jgi:hypothetical protein